MIFRCFLIFPIIVGIKALHTINEKSKNEIKNFGIVTLFFCSFLGGLFMILLAAEEPDLKSRLYEIKDLQKKSIITIDEYEKMREGIIYRTIISK